MSDDLADFQRQLDDLYMSAVKHPVQRRPHLVAAAIHAIAAVVEADAQLERAFGHMVPHSHSQPPPLHHSDPPLPYGLHRQVETPMQSHVNQNPALADALRRGQD